MEQNRKWNTKVWTKMQTEVWTGRTEVREMWGGCEGESCGTMRTWLDITFVDSRKGWDWAMKQLPRGAGRWVGIGSTVQTLEATKKKRTIEK